MAVSVTGSLNISALITDARTGVAGALLGTASRVISGAAAWDIVAGTAAGQADRAWGDTRVLTTGATDSLDLATGGNLTDSFGAAVVFVKLRAVFLWTAAANTTTIQLARPAANGVPLFGAASGAMAPLSGNGFTCWQDQGAGVTVTAATADLISVINSASASATYSIILVGTSV